MLYLLHKLNLG